MSTLSFEEHADNNTDAGHGERAVQPMGGGRLYHSLTPGVIVTDKTFTPGCLWSLPEGHQVGKPWVSNHK